MRTSLKAALLIGSLTYSFTALAQDGNKSKNVDQGKSSTSAESNGMMGMMQQMHSDMGDMMNNMADPKMKEHMQRMHENMGKMMQQMMSKDSGMGQMHGGMMQGAEKTEMMKGQGMDKMSGGTMKSMDKTDMMKGSDKETK